MKVSSEQHTAVAEGIGTVTRESFEEIVQKYMKDAYFIALGFVGNREDAMDLSQEAFARAWSHIGRLRSEESFFPWFYQILKNLCFSHLRRMKLRQTQRIVDEEGKNIDIESNVAGFDPEAVAERNENKDRVWRAINKLDDKHKEVIILRHFQNLSYDEISKLLFCNKGTITSRLYYARKQLKEMLDREKGGRQE